MGLHIWVEKLRLVYHEDLVRYFEIGGLASSSYLEIPLGINVRNYDLLREK